MSTRADCLEVLLSRAGAAEARYGPFTSTHEALGVLTEEYYELIEAIRANALEVVRSEALQIAAVALRCAEACRQRVFIERSQK